MSFIPKKNYDIKWEDNGITLYECAIYKYDG